MSAVYPIITVFILRSLLARVEARLISNPQTNPAQHGPPYGLMMAVVGGVPTLATDVPIAAVLLAFFLASAAAHMTILQLNNRSGLKFSFSAMMFMMCVLRSVALCVRIVWASHPDMASIAVSSGIMTQTGNVLILIANLLLTQRVLRGYHAKFGWHPATTLVLRFLVGCVVVSLIMAIAVTIQTFLTLDPDVRRVDRLVQLAAGTYMAVLAFLPLPIIAVAAWFPRSHHVEKFGAGRWRSKVRLLVFTSAVATLGAAFRVYTGFAPRPISNPAWYHSRACYYGFNFVTDLTVSAAFLLTRFDRRFIVPDGAKEPGDYGKGARVRPLSTAPCVGNGGGNSEDGEKDKDLEESIGLKNGDSSGSNNSISRSSSRSNSKETNGGTSYLPTYNAMAKHKGKGKEVVESGDMRTSSDARPTSKDTTSDAQTQTKILARDWSGIPWPFRTSWVAIPRSFLGTSTSSEPLSSDDIILPVSCPSVDEPVRRFGSIDEMSNQWTEEANNTYAQEPQPAHLRTVRRFHPQPTQPASSTWHELGQAITSNESIYMNHPTQPGNELAWPITDNLRIQGRPAAGDLRRCSSANEYPRHGDSGMKPLPQRSATGRGRGFRTPDNTRIEGGWI